MDLEIGEWEMAHTTQIPGIRICQSMVYDTESDVIIMFGGHNGLKNVGETWVYDFNLNTWTNMEPSVNPPVGLVRDLFTT